MKRLLKVFAFLGGLGAIGWLMRNRFVGMALNREPTKPEPAPEPTTDPPSEPDILRIPGVTQADANVLQAAGITTASQLAQADAEALAEQTGLDGTLLASWIEQASALA